MNDNDNDGESDVVCNKKKYPHSFSSVKSVSFPGVFHQHFVRLRLMSTGTRLYKKVLSFLMGLALCSPECQRNVL